MQETSNLLSLVVLNSILTSLQERMQIQWETQLEGHQWKVVLALILMDFIHLIRTNNPTQIKEVILKQDFQQTSIKTWRLNHYYIINKHHKISSWLHHRQTHICSKSRSKSWFLKYNNNYWLSTLKLTSWVLACSWDLVQSQLVTQWQWEMLFRLWFQKTNLIVFGPSWRVLLAKIWQESPCLSGLTNQ